MVETRRILEARPLQREVGRIGCWNDAWPGRRKQTFRRGVNEEEKEEEGTGGRKAQVEEEEVYRLLEIHEP